jgi:hypothetical protein
MIARPSTPLRIALMIALIAVGVALVAGGIVLMTATAHVLFVSESDAGGPIGILAIGVGVTMIAIGIVIIGGSIARSSHTREVPDQGSAQSPDPGVPPTTPRQ